MYRARCKFTGPAWLCTKVRNPANGSWRMVQVLSTYRFLEPGLIPHNGSWRILRVLTIYSDSMNSSDLNDPPTAVYGIICATQTSPRLHSTTTRRKVGSCLPTSYPTPTLSIDSREIEAVEVHHLVPSRDEA